MVQKFYGVEQRKKQLVADRQRAFRLRQEADGMIQINGFVPGRVANEVKLLIKRLRDDPCLEVGPLRNTVTGRLERLDK